MTATSDVSIGEHLERWQSLMCRWARSAARNYRLELEDVLQEIRMEAVRQWDKYDPNRGQVSTWLELVARQAIGHMRDRQRVHNVPAMSLATPLVVNNHDVRDRTVADLAVDPAAIDPADGASLTLIREQVRSAVASLPPEQSRAVRRRFFEDAPVNQVGGNQLAAGLRALSETLTPLDV